MISEKQEIANGPRARSRPSLLRPAHRADNLAKAKQMAEAPETGLKQPGLMESLSAPSILGSLFPRPRWAAASTIRKAAKQAPKVPPAQTVRRTVPAQLELVRTAAFLVWAVAGQGRDLSRILAISRAILLAICADTGAGFMGALFRGASHSLNLPTKQRENSSTSEIPALNDHGRECPKVWSATICRAGGSAALLTLARQNEIPGFGSLPSSQRLCAIDCSSSESWLLDGVTA
jgi:hypothetical protein